VTSVVYEFFIEFNEKLCFAFWMGVVRSPFVLSTMGLDLSDISFGFEVLADFHRS
jgi:hypothetical protein